MVENGRKRRGNSRFIFFFVIILLVLGSLSWAGYKWLRNSDLLIIKNVTITGNENVSTTTIHDLLKEYIGQNLLEISSKEIRKKLLQVKRIEVIKVVRLYPGTLKIKLIERKGFLYLKSIDGDLFPIDEKCMIMEYAVYPSKEDLPIVHSQYPSSQLHVGRVLDDPFLKKVVALQKQIITERPDFIKSISEYYQDSNSVVIVDNEYGTRVILVSQYLNDQLRRYQFVQENGDINRNSIFDLRFKNQVVVRPEVQ